MTSKAFLLLGLLVAFLFLISTEVAARDISETSTSDKTNVADMSNNGVEDAKYREGYGGGYNNGGYPGNGGGGGGNNGGYPGRGGGGPGYPGRGGGNCRHGCCGGSYYGGCRRCCSYAGEAVDAEIKN